MDLRNKKAFSLAEMMVVMLILSIVLAASMPIITKRNHTTAQLSQLDVPIGTVVAYAGTTAPDGWLLCNGQSIAAAGDPTGKYVALRSIVGNNVPDLRGRVPVGKDDMGGTVAGRITKDNSGLASPWAKTLGNAGGEESHKLTKPEMPIHNHAISTDQSGTNGGNYTADRGGGPTGLGGYSGYDHTYPEGGDGYHNNVQPSLILNYIIKY